MLHGLNMQLYLMICWLNRRAYYKIGIIDYWLVGIMDDMTTVLKTKEWKATLKAATVVVLMVVMRMAGDLKS